MGRGALVFKGESKPLSSSSSRKKDSTKIKKRSLSTCIGADTDTNASNRLVDVSISHQQQVSSEQSSQVTVGRGTITVSGTVVTGYGTKFNDDVQVGDAILIGNEMRIITMRLSDISLNISSILSSTNINTSRPISYSYIRKPLNVVKESAIEQKKMALDKAADIERHQNAFSSIATAVPAISEDDGNANTSTTEVVYRERTEHGNYRIKRMKVNQQLNITDRSEMLNIRSKKTSDKYC